MFNTNRFTEVARLIGEPARAAMLTTLMDGRAYTAGELARAAGVTAQTASAHLARLTEGGLLRVRRQGRHRYHALANAEVARLLESIMELASGPRPQPSRVTTGPRDAAMRLARTCYDHFAGRLGVAIADALVATGAVELNDDTGILTDTGVQLLQRHGVMTAGEPETDGGSVSRRPLCRVCLDWSERRPHLGGRLGAAICDHHLRHGYVRRVGGTRALQVTAGGRKALLDMYGIRQL